MRALLATFVIAAAASVRVTGSPDADVAIREAIVQAVKARMGADADVTIESLRLPMAWTRPTVSARPAPGAKLDRTMRFALGAPAGSANRVIAWTGAADVELAVAVEHLHTRREVARGTEIVDEDVQTVRHVVDGPLRPWPSADAVGRARVLRDLPSGACLSPGSIQALPLVRAGQPVLALARVGDVVAEASLVAADNGEKGSVIRVVNPESRRTLRARVSGAGRVEVIQ
jgi:flagella basal body P-ring formation protein FlgA